ncbi:MAG TPA: anti-sigma factor [Thermoleophilaceae bacterium]|nr:anti-sigma factor [Thermoleophilaceae bacterium]
MNRNLVEIALQELGAEDRALLELSVVREVSDEDIADLLGVEISHVLIKREEALDRVAVLIGDSPESVLATMHDLPSARWRDEGEEPPPTPETQPEPEPGPEPEPEPVPEQPRQSRFMLALLGGLSITLVVVVILALTGDDDEPVTEPASPPAADRGGDGALDPVAGSKATGKAAISGGDSPRLSIAVKGLPDPPSGGYVVWLYDSVTDARSVAGTARGTFDLRARLPGDYRRYRSIDVSREPSDGNSAHSGQSVLRVPLADVPGGR